MIEVWLGSSDREIYHLTMQSPELWFIKPKQETSSSICGVSGLNTLWSYGSNLGRQANDHEYNRFWSANRSLCLDCLNVLMTVL